MLGMCAMVTSAAEKVLTNAYNEEPRTSDLSTLILVKRHPLNDLSLFQNQLENLTLIIQDGNAYKNII